MDLIHNYYYYMLCVCDIAIKIHDLFSSCVVYITKFIKYEWVNKTFAFNYIVRLIPFLLSTEH